MLGTPGLSRRRARARRGAALIFRLWGANLHTRGLERLPSGPCVLVANHASYLDGIILTAVLPPDYSFVIKREMTRVPLAHFLLRRLDSQFLERHDARGSARDTRRILRQASRRQHLAFFPEGTFREQPGLRRFHNGAFVSATRGQVPLVPAVIHGSRQMLPSDQWLPRPGRLAVTILDPIEPPEHPEAVAWLIASARQRILAELPEPDLHPQSVSKNLA
jgi:1-acyl-sn-glycerol-3-phosphate acyltransferase